MSEKPFSPSCERNRDAILNVLKETIPSQTKNLLEIGSGTGQHAVYFAPEFPNLSWQTSDHPENHHGINQWLDESNATNIKKPIPFFIGLTNFPREQYDFVFTANTLHIMSFDNVTKLIDLLGKNLKKDSFVGIYGPFNYQGKYTSESNARFDIWLKNRDPLSAIRDFEKVCEKMKEADLEFVSDFEMPANNRFLLFKHL